MKSYYLMMPADILSAGVIVTGTFADVTVNLIINKCDNSPEARRINASGLFCIFFIEDQVKIRRQVDRAPLSRYQGDVMDTKNRIVFLKIMRKN